MVTVTAKNLTNSPFDFLDSDNAVVRFPAFGTATGDFEGVWLDLLNFWIAAGGFEAGESPPVNTVAPAVTGNSVVGSVLTTSDGTWDGEPELEYAWQQSADGSTGWSFLSGESGKTYTIAAPDEGKYLRAVVTATNPGGSVNAESNLVGPVTAE